MLTISREKITPNLILILFISGIFAPTSINGVISSTYEVVYLVYLIIVFLIAASVSNTVNQDSLIFSICIVTVLLLSTLVSPFRIYSYGALLPFIGYCCLISNRWDYLINISVYKNMLVIVSTLFLLASVFVITKIVDIDFVLFKNYSGLNQGTTALMILLRKPVFTFVTHSYAGFYHFLFFYLNFKTFESLKSRTCLWISILFIVSNLFLRSVSSYSFAGIELLLLAIYAAKDVRLMLNLTFVVSVCALYLAVQFNSILKEISIGDILTTFGSETNGFKGRFGNQSPLKPMLDYIQENPFRPVGITNNVQFLFGDSGLIILVLRGSVILLICFYLSFILFLKRNLFFSKDYFILILIFLVFELSNTNILYRRTLSVIPFIIVHLNNLYLIKLRNETGN